MSIAKRLSKEGVKCYLIDKSLREETRILKSLRKFEWATFGNFASPLAVQAVADVVNIELKRIDILLNIAGVGIYKPIGKLTLEDITNSINVNLIAPFILTQSLIGLLKKGRHPVIINVGSGMGVISQARRSAYCSSKFGLRGLSLSLYKELKGRVDVCLLTLGSVMDNFGTGGIEVRKGLKKSGKKYLSLAEVTDKLMKIITSEHRKKEYVFYPNGYGKS